MRYRRLTLSLRLGAATAVLGLLAGCTAGAAPAASNDLVVFAASSLSDTFPRLGAEFEAAHPGVRVRFDFDGSQALVDQLREGAPADVFASADRTTMDAAASAGLMSGTPVRFASNRLTLIVPPGNPARITGLDASLTGHKLVVCAPTVPCGAATGKLAALLGVTLHPVSEETKVTDVRAKVETGQADAGIVYVTDARAAGAKVAAIPIGRSAEVRTDYLVAVTAASRQAALAAAFLALVTGDEGRAVLEPAGFGG